LASLLLSKNVNIKLYKTVIKLLVLYGCETWSLTLREDHRLSVLENRVLRRIFGPNRDIGCSRKLHNEAIHNMYPSPSIITVIKSRPMKEAVHVALTGEEERIQGFGGKARRKQTARRT
jgi:hypothetical protein